MESASDLSHDEMLEVTTSSLCTMFSCDPLLADLPPDIILEEVLAQIAVEHGQSITLFSTRDQSEPLKIIVPRETTVNGLKKAIARHFEIYQQRTKMKVKISWKYIWKTYDLYFDGIIINNDSSLIDEYGLQNKSILSFKKIRKRKKN